MRNSRITVTLPEYIYKNLTTTVSSGKVSSFVAEALEEKLLKEKLKKTDPVSEFFSVGKKLPEIETAEIIQAIEKGRS